MRIINYTYYGVSGDTEQEDKITLEDKKKKRIKITGSIWGGAFFLTLVYYIVRITLPEGVEYRVWLQKTGAVWNFLVMPVAFLVFLVCLIQNSEKLSVTLRGIFSGLAAGVFTLYFLIAAGTVAVFGLSLGSEWQFADGIIETCTEYMQSVPSFSTYYEDLGPFLKKEYKPLSDILLLTLKKKYGEKFALAGEWEEGRTYQVYPVSSPETIFCAEEMFGYFLDDYKIMRAKRLMEEKAAEICPGRVLYASDKENYSPATLAKEITVECNGVGDARKCADDIAAMIAYVLEDDFFGKRDRSVKLAVKCVDEDGESGVAYFRFGNHEDGMTIYGYAMDYYTDASLVYKELLYQFDALAGQKEEDSYEETESSVNHEDSCYFVEGAYKALYGQLFEGEGYPYDCRYNAKGNFYAWLCDGEGELESTQGIFEYTETVVYDRESKNGKCHLFVHYRTYYRDGAEFTTDILDMYAVDMETGQVYISGRHAWEDVGNAEYCEATGEP